MRVILGFLLILGACFSPDSTGISFKCDAQNPCTEGFSCIAGLCATAQAAAVDAGISMDLLPGTGCAKGNGQPFGAAYGCPGTFDPVNPASSLCAAGWSLCNMGSQVNLTICDSISHFFSSGFMGIADWGGTNTCTGSDITLPYRTSLGCGNRTNVGAVYPCNGFNSGLLPSDPNWSSPLHATSLDQTTNTLATNGVLCCK
jgi:hypothetical protein